MNVIAWLKFKLAYFEATIQLFNYYATETYCFCIIVLFCCFFLYILLLPPLSLSLHLLETFVSWLYFRYFITKKRSFFQAAVVSILLYGCTTWTLTKRLEKKLDGNYTRMLQAILNKSWRQHPTRHQLYSHLTPITKTIQVRWTRHAGHCLRSRDELLNDLLLWTPTYGWAKAGQPARTYI